MPNNNGLHEPIRFVSDVTLREAERSRVAIAEAPLGELAGQAMESEWAAYGAARWAARTSILSELESEPTVEEDFKALEGQLSTENIQKLRESSRTKDALRYNTNFMKEDVERDRAFAQHGWSGVAARVAAGVLDPFGIMLGILTGGGHLAAKGNRFAHIIKTAASVSVENAAIEALLVKSDTQRDTKDIVIAATGAAILGSGIGAVARRRPDLTNIVKGSDELDTAVDTLLKDSLKEQVAPRQVKGVIMDRVAINNAEINHVNELHSIVAKATPARPREKELAKHTSRIKKNKTEIAELEDMRVAHKARVAAGFGAPRSVQEATRNANRADMIDQIYQPKIDERMEAVLLSEQRIGKIQEAKKAQKDLYEFSKMSSTERVHKLYPEGAPRVSQTVKQVAADMEAVGPRHTPRVPLKEQEVPEGASAPTREEITVDEIEAKADEDEYIYTTGETTEKMATRLVEEMMHKEKVTSRVLPTSISDRVQGSFVTLDQSKNPLVRALDQHILENPQGGVTPEMTVDALQTHFLNTIRFKVHNRYNPSYQAWSKSQGRGVFMSAIDPKNHRARFNELVFVKILYPETQADEFVTTAAKGYADGFAEALRIRKLEGEAGFDNVKSKNYAPIIYDEGKFTSEMARLGEVPGQRLVIQAFTEGYMTGGLKLKQDLAEKVAKMQYIRLKEAGSSTSSAFRTILSEGDRARFLSDLEDAGVEKNILSTFLQEKEAKDIADNVSNRAKLSLRINPLVVVGDGDNSLRLLDILNTNIPETGDKYFKEAAAGAAFARKGFKTHAQYVNMVKATEALGQRMGLKPSKIKQESEMLLQVADTLRGRSIDKDPGSNLVVGSRRLREATSILRLQQILWSQMAEPARALTKLGVGVVLKSVPSTAIFRRTAKRVGGRKDGYLKEPEAREIEFLLGYSDSESVKATAVTTRHDDFGESEVHGKIRRVVDNALANGRAAHSVMSGFMAVQGGAENLVSKSIKRRLVMMADGKKGIKPQDLVEIGFDEPFVKEFTGFMKNNPKYDTWRGKKVRMLNIDAMTPEMRERVAVGMNRLSRRIIQRQYTGDESMWLNKALGKSIGQFRTFSITSMDKQLIHDIKWDKLDGMQTLLWSSFLGTMAYSAQTLVNSFGAKDQEEYLDERLTPANIAYGAFNKMPQVAILGIGADLAATMNLLPEAWKGAGPRQGPRDMGTMGSAVPAAGVLGEAYDLTTGLVGAIRGDEDDGTDYSKQIARHTRNLIPGMKYIGVGQLTQQIINNIGD